MQSFFHDSTPSKKSDFCTKVNQIIDRASYDIFIDNRSHLPAKMDQRINSDCTLANGLERCSLGAGVLCDAVAHAGYSVARGTEPVTLYTGVSTWVARPEALDSRAHLRLATHDDEDEDALSGVGQVRHIPEPVWTTSYPRDHVKDPGHAHDDDQLEADLAQRGPVTEKVGRKLN